eukprot:TRINITY_DN3267_c0_g1_i1.p1 TRINITY_DN3267_c0_g1~~TRINITY_DN3267_c0_g1_i1.p1  ORF type:complete len:192 (-),score=49.01 TRINITY_DN3267_c0_g1_i1:44-619(-)
MMEGRVFFGENYIQEFVEKAPSLPKDIEWHFIGHIQTNKVRQLLRVPNLSVVETVDRLKLATVLEKECVASGRESLDIFIQVNTSLEDSKSGCSAEECVDLVRKVIETCPHLKFRGLMTIGNPDPEKCTDDFDLLFKLREDVSKAIGVESLSLELSMGMSGDFEKAIAHGSTIVRVGSSIFGARSYPKRKE